MPRNMSFFYTQQQVREGTKGVTRRIGWDFLKSGDVLWACVKCQGLGKGGKIERIRKIRVKSARPERLDKITAFDVVLEGFFYMTVPQFIEMFCGHMKCKPDQIVNRIEFEYIE